MYIENIDGKYDQYIASYKELVIDVAKLMIVEDGHESNQELEAMWSNLFNIETKIAKVFEMIVFFNLPLLMYFYGIYHG